MTNESYPSCFQHCTIHLNPDTGEMHSDGDHRVRVWIENKIAALKQQIENMECCGNCKHYSKRSDCVSKHNMDAHSVCDYWTSDGKTRKERE